MLTLPKAIINLLLPFEANGTIQCGGVVVRPGDLIVGDDDSVVVVPALVAEKVIDWVEEHEAVEEYVKGLIQQENVAPRNVQSNHRSHRGAVPSVSGWVG
ncbi:MAG: hypothetical protein IIC24_04925 [Chloroflexi bacterium]|nr:hypothetical protein [Chloroflexota bacterium]